MSLVTEKVDSGDSKTEEIEISHIFKRRVGRLERIVVEDLVLISGIPDNKLNNDIKFDKLKKEAMKYKLIGKTLVYSSFLVGGVVGYLLDHPFIGILVSGSAGLLVEHFLIGALNCSSFEEGLSESNRKIYLKALYEMREYLKNPK